MSKNLFREHYLKYVDLPIIPLCPNQKNPIIKEWSKYCNELPSEELIDKWKSSYPDSNIGLCLGSASKMIAVDIDKEEALSLAPLSPIVKKGAKGETRFFKFNGEEQFKRHDIGIELLSSGSQTVMPPSIHPQTQKPYEWLQFNCNWDELPNLDPKFVEKYRGNRKSSDNISSSDGTRCNHGSHTKLSEMLIAGLHNDDSPDTIVNSLLAYDEKLNKEISYFLCPSRKEWKTNNKIVNAYVFVVEAMKRHSELVKSQFKFTIVDDLLGENKVNKPLLPLPSLSLSVPTLSPDIIPEPLREWLVDEAERMSVPAEMIAIPALVSLSILLGRKIPIQPKLNDSGWKEIPNLWGMVVSAPGQKKSPAMKCGLRFFHEINKKIKSENKEKNTENKSKLDSLEAQISGIKSAIKNSYGGEDEEEK